MVVCFYNPSTQEAEQGDDKFQVNLSNLERPFSKKKKRRKKEKRKKNK
jgi:hypothetical protein